MSQVRKEVIECPHCHKEGEYSYWSSVNVDLDPELREKIFNEDLFMYKCPHCGQETGIPAGTLYHDMTHHFMIFFEFFKPDDYDYEPIEIPTVDLGMHKDYVMRAVYGLYRFKEKIIILEEGLNDVAIERMKYMVRHIIMPEIAEKGFELYFSHTTKPDEENEHGRIIFFYKDDEDKTQYVGVTMGKYYEHCLACEIDPRMAVKSCQCVDEEWISRQLKKEDV